MLAVIIKGNPKFINTSDAKDYYADIEAHLRGLGYEVQYDTGKDYTRPRQDADLYIAHSRGAGRYDFMEEKNKKKFVKLGTLDGVIDPVDKKWQLANPPGGNVPPPREHFIYDEVQRATVNKMVEETSEVHPLIAQALKDPFLGPAAFKSGLAGLVEIKDNGKVVGFAIPFQEKDGYWRTGTIYIDPKHRKKGIAHRWIEEFMEGKTGRAWIESRNAASIAAYTAAGLTKSGKRTTSKETGRVFDEYLTEEAGMESNRPQVLSW